MTPKDTNSINFERSNSSLCFYFQERSKTSECLFLVEMENKLSKNAIAVYNLILQIPLVFPFKENSFQFFTLPFLVSFSFLNSARPPQKWIFFIFSTKKSQNANEQKSSSWKIE